MKKLKGNYYKLNQLSQFVDLQERALKYRMNNVKKKYQNRQELLYKDGRCWKIHESIIFEFDRKRNTKRDNQYHTQSLVTISPDGNYCKESLKEVILEAFEQLSHLRSDLRIRYYIEQGERGSLFHVHFIVNLSSHFENAIRRACEHYIAANIDVRAVFLERNLIGYLEKEVRAKGFLKS
ncbi:MAG: hypothetical protein H6599_09380 [Flavobacteriales bacterium]|nr:hypothetical protein [Flavobacteriales bacterium]